MPNNDTFKSARQMIDDLINDDPEQAKQSFHDFLKAKTISKLNPEIEDIDDIPMGDDGESVTDDSNPENREDMQFTDYDPDSEDNDPDDSELDKDEDE
jgi:hypothetical protein